MFRRKRLTPRKYYEQLVAGRTLSARWANIPLAERKKLVDNAARDGAFSESHGQAEIEGLALSDFETLTFEGHAKVLTDTLPERERRRLEGRIYAGPFPLDDYNAHAVRVPNDGGYVVLINYGFAGLLYAIVSHIMDTALLAEFARGDDGFDWSEVTRHVRRTLLVFTRSGRWLADPSSPVMFRDKADRMITVAICSSALRFVMAHEYAHAIMGHLDRNASRRMRLVDTDERFAVVRKSFREEMEADVMGMEMTVRVLPRIVDDAVLRRLNVTTAAPLVAFEIARMVEQVAGARCTTHPPVEARTAAIQSWIEALAKRSGMTKSSMFGLMEVVIRALAHAREGL